MASEEEVETAEAKVKETTADVKDAVEKS